MNLKDQKIEETLNSFKGIEKAEADPFLYEKVLNKIQLRRSEVKNFTWNYRWQLAALVVLLIVNSFFVLRSSSTTENNSANNSFANEYFGNNNSYNY